MYEEFIIKSKEGNFVIGDLYSLDGESFVVTECKIVDTNRTIANVSPTHPISIGVHTIGGIAKACIEELQMKIPFVISFDGTQHLIQVTEVKELEDNKKEVTLELDALPKPITATYEVQR